MGDDVDIKEKEEVAAVKVELKEDTDANDNNLDSKEEDDVTKETVKTEEEMETEPTETGEEEPAEKAEESEDKLKHSDSLLEDKEEKESLAVPVVPAKVNISMKLTSSVPVERRESVLSQPSDSEEASTEFDIEAVVVPVKTQEQLDAAKPRLKGKKFTVMPPMTKDSDLSGLCSIM